MTDPPAKKTKSSVPPPVRGSVPPPARGSAPLSQLSEYELQRTKNMQANEEKMNALGLGGKGKLDQSIPQTAEESAELPNAGIEDLAKNMPPVEFDKFEFAPLPDQEARNFELGQYMAKAWQSDDGSWKCYAARINLMTKKGPWIIFESDKCARPRQLPDSYQIATR